jgi:sugar phosphate permease
MVIAFFGLPVLAAIDRFVSDRPERDPHVSQPELDYIFGAESHRRGAVLDPARATSGAELPPGERPTPYREIFLNRSVALMFIAGFFGLLATWGLTTWLPTYGVQQLKLPLIIAGSLSSIVYAGSLVGVIAGGFISDRLFATKRTPIWLFGGLIMAAAILWATTFQPGAPLIEMYAAFFIAGLAASMSPTGQLFAPYLAELLTPGAVGRSLGVVVLGGMIGSAVAQPLVAALVIQTPSGPQFWPAFVMFAACGVVTSVCVALMIEPRVHRTYLGYLLAGRKEGSWQPSAVSA